MTDLNDPHTGEAVGKSEDGPERHARGQHRKPAIPTKSAQMSKLLQRPRGATIPELCAATQWQPHSVRALLSGMRKKGARLVRETRKSGEGSYRIVAADVVTDEAITIAAATQAA
ncbi:DUF3489 domain-containing protein [Sandarakinorhabdus sp.]|jgi:hypothetical protein|uniref:DUF3489 domain-containing protein n=1 Tax=Sandarakinorhabdus sp. TaxID=1916663 RepID=UPI0028A5C4AD|nr:DUF3489 domain-containing protein [Sandarakinorhabdus sp.]